MNLVNTLPMQSALNLAAAQPPQPSGNYDNGPNPYLLNFPQPPLFRGAMPGQQVMSQSNLFPAPNSVLQTNQQVPVSQSGFHKGNRQRSPHKKQFSNGRKNYRGNNNHSSFRPPQMVPPPNVHLMDNAQNDPYSSQQSYPFSGHSPQNQGPEQVQQQQFGANDYALNYGNQPSLQQQVPPLLQNQLSLPFSSGNDSQMMNPMMLSPARAQYMVPVNPGSSSFNNTSHRSPEMVYPRMGFPNNPNFGYGPFNQGLPNNYNNGNSSSKSAQHYRGGPQPN